MALYEIVLRFPDREEVRITDRDGYRAGDEIVIAGRTFLVIGTEPPQAVHSAGRFVLEPRDLSRALARRGTAASSGITPEWSKR